MKTLLLVLLISLASFSGKSQTYFPPINSPEWDTLSPESLGWCTEKIDSLYEFLEANDAKAFILLKDGKIVLEQYFNGHTPSSNWYWASAGKTLTAVMVGIAQQEGFLNITDTTSAYLGSGWTNATPSEEEKITIRHQLTMSSGLDDGVSDPNCTTNTCLEYLADAGTRWAYHNAPYTLLDQVIENASGQTLNAYTAQKVKTPTGMDGAYINQGFNKVFYSTARSMARFGLLILHEGNWDGTQIMTDPGYFNAMVNTSQSLNESYGYLWWLNGKNSFMIPQSQFVFPGAMAPNAPADMISALGKNGQFINVIPSQNMVWIRMGNAPDNSLVPFLHNNDIWDYINDLGCSLSSANEQPGINHVYTVSPNPAHNHIIIRTNKPVGSTGTFSLHNTHGQCVSSGQIDGSELLINTTHLPRGCYYMTLQTAQTHQTVRVILD